MRQTAPDSGLSDPDPAPAREELAYRHLLVFARKVAHELLARRVPEDLYLTQDARPPARKEPFGFHQLGADIVPGFAEAREGIGGWRLLSYVAEQVQRIDRTGTPDPYPERRLTRELWLLRTGAIHEVTLEMDARGTTTCTHAPLTLAGALRLDRAAAVRQTTQREHGVRWVVRTNELDGDRCVPGPGDRLSALLEQARNRGR